MLSSSTKHNPISEKFIFLLEEILSFLSSSLIDIVLDSSAIFIELYLFYCWSWIVMTDGLLELPNVSIDEPFIPKPTELEFWNGGIDDSTEPPATLPDESIPTGTL